MSTKKYMSLERLTEYDGLIKDYVDGGLAEKSASSHTHDGRYYTESEIDSKISAINTSIDKVTSGETVVSKATSATYATNATSATNATLATSATQLNSSAGSATQPIYFSSGKPVACTYTLETSISADLFEEVTDDEIDAIFVEETTE